MVDKKDEKKVLKMLPGQEQIDGFRAALRYVRTLMEDPEGVKEIQATLAKLRKQKYDALVEAGFKPEQALEIIAKSSTCDIF